MNTVYILITVIAFSLGEPKIYYQEVNSSDTCKSMSIEVKRMTKKVMENVNIETFCHTKEIK